MRGSGGVSGALEQAEAGEGAEGLVEGFGFKADGGLEQRARDGLVGGAIAGHEEEAPSRVVGDLIPGDGEGGHQIEVVVGGVVQVFAPAGHRGVGEGGLDLLDVVGYGQAGTAGQIAAGQLEGQRQMTEAGGHGIEMGLGYLPQVLAQEVAALCLGEEIETEGV